jgi:hypothetical protein
VVLYVALFCTSARRDEPALGNLLLLGQRLDVWRRPSRPGLHLLHVTLRSRLWNTGISTLCLRRDHHRDGRMMMPWFAAVAHLLNSPAPAPLLLGPFSFVGSGALSGTPSSEACRRGRRSRRCRSALCQVGKTFQKPNPLGHPQGIEPLLGSRDEPKTGSGASREKCRLRPTEATQTPRDCAASDLRHVNCNAVHLTQEALGRSIAMLLIPFFRVWLLFPRPAVAVAGGGRSWQT